MAMKKFLFTGFGPATTEENIQSFLGGFGSVVDVDILRDGNATVLVLTSRISNFWHEGRMLNVWRVLH
jgi:hypothetical protein